MSRILHNRRVAALLLIVVVALGGLAYYQYGQAPRGPAVVAVQSADLSAEVTANGRVQSTRTVHLAFSTSGLVSAVRVNEGSIVQPNDVLAELDNSDAQRRLQQAQLNVSTRENDLKRAQSAPSQGDLDSAQAAVKKAALALGIAQSNYNTSATPQNSAARDIAQIDYDQARANFNRVAAGTSADDLKSIQNALDFARLDLQSAQKALDQTRIVAPFAGVVTEVLVRPGELAGGFTPVITVLDPTSLEIQAEIDEIDVAHVANGQSVSIAFDAFPGQTFQGRVKRLFPAASTSRGNTVFFATVGFDAPGLTIRPGMAATLKIATVEKKNSLVVPSRAIKTAGTQKYVTVISSDGVRQDLVVTVGVTNGTQTEIVSGLKQGMMVVLE